jgi:betaine-aldehyde dehydrogenase
MLIPDQLDLIAGRSARPQETTDVILCHPDTGDALTEGLATATDQVDAALASADQLHQSGGWFDLDVDAKSAALTRFAHALEAISADLAVPESINTGIPISVTQPMTSGVAGFLHGAAEQVRASTERAMDGRHGATVLHRLPFGPAVVIAPWNAPSPSIVGKSAAAMAAGCPVIVKPSEWAPGTADLVATAAMEAELPPGLFQLVHGGAAVGAQLVADRRSRVVVFTGGQPAGRAIAAAAAPNFARLQLELGGNNPAIVCADADIAATARSLADGATKLNGQWCEAPGRILVEASVADDLRDALLTELARRRIGSCLDPDTEIGPLSHQLHHQKVTAAVQALDSRADTEVHRVGELPDLGGWFFPPTLITGIAANESLSETFGPVMTLHSVADEQAALAAASVGDDGLAAYVFSADTERAMALGARLRAGEVKVNGTGLFDLCGDSEQSFWGASGIGGHGDATTFELFRGSRIVGVDDANAPM